MVSIEPTIEKSFKLPMFSGMVNRVPMFLPNWKVDRNVNTATNKFGTVLFSGGVLTQRHRDVLDLLTYFYNVQKVKTDDGYVGRVYFSEFDLLHKARRNPDSKQKLGGYYWNKLHAMLEELATVCVTVDLRSRTAACNPKTTFANDVFYVGPVLTAYSKGVTYGDSYVEFSPRYFHLLASDACLFSTDPIYAYLLSHSVSPVEKAIFRYVLSNDRIRIRLDSLLDSVYGGIPVSYRMKRIYINRLLTSQFELVGAFFDIAIGKNEVLYYERDYNKIAMVSDAAIPVNTRVRMQQYLQCIRELSVIKKPVVKYQVSKQAIVARQRMCQNVT